ncbi:MAG TPA: diacylglycerol kinase family protein [Polyangiaceae bacterium]
MKVRVLVNPAAGSGAAVAKLTGIETALKRHRLDYDVVRTQGPGDAPRLVREADEDGVDCIAVVGGDGTLNEVVQAYIDDKGQAQRGPDLALIPAGTGGDFRRCFGLGDSADAAISRLAESAAQKVDLGVVRLTSKTGESKLCAFINVTSFGIGGLTDRIVNSGPKWMGGRAAFFLGTLRAMATYKNAPVAVRVDGALAYEGLVLNVAIANGRYFGGGMFIAPNAELSDGLLDLVVLGDLTVAQSLRLAPKLYRGLHLNEPGVRHTRGAVVEAEPLRPTEDVLIDMDGETPGRLPLRAELHRDALRFRA